VITNSSSTTLDHIPSGYASLDLPHPIPASGQGLWTLAGQWVVLGLGTQFPGGVTQAITWQR